jgi:putative transposase
MLDVLKVRIYPNQEQGISLAKSFGCSRFVWNFYLNKTNTQYKVHEKISNTRQDFLHKLSRQLCDENQVIVAENLCIKGLARTKLAKSIHDAGFGMLLNFISYKLEREGGQLVQVDRFFPSSKLCSCCGHQHDVLNLSIGEWTCPSCQPTQDRDENAARNLRAEGRRILETNTVGHTEIQACGEAVRLVGTCTKKRVSEKQESPAIPLCG